MPAIVAKPAASPATEALRKFATGAGVRVAVIDTGVAPHPEITHLRAGRDFVAADALHDCDNHGTAVAGIIAGRTLGIAPDAEIISVRQTSAHYRDVDAGNLQTLTDAIHNALDEGASDVGPGEVRERGAVQRAAGVRQVVYLSFVGASATSGFTLAVESA